MTSDESTKEKGPRHPPTTYRSVTDGDLRDAMGLNEFLEGVGVVMQLPPRPTTAAMPAVKPVREPSPRRRHPIAWSIGGVALLTLAGLLIANLALRESDPLPPGLLGRWQTRDVRYSARAFEVRRGSLVLQRGPQVGDIAIFRISRARVKPRGNRTWVDLEYMEAGAIQTLSLTLTRQGNSDVVTMRNQPEMHWLRY